MTYRCPVHRDDLSGCVGHCHWWLDEWFLARHALQKYWHDRKYGVVTPGPKTRLKFAQRHAAIAEIVGQAA